MPQKPKKIRKKSITQTLILKGKAVSFIDWANVYGWAESLVEPTNPKDLYKYLKSYKEVKAINFYYGKDNNSKSREFLENIKKMGFLLFTKPVKYIVVGKLGTEDLKKRKCDFDIEICMSVYDYLKKGYETFLFFSGDGDFAPLYRYLINNRKRVLVIYEKGHLGREVWFIKRGLFKTRLSYVIKNNPR